MSNNKQSKNSPPSSEFEHQDRCPSCGSPCNIFTDLDDKDYCNDCRVVINNKQNANNAEDLIEVSNTFKTYEQMYELLINNDFSFLSREYGTMNYPEIRWMIEYFTEKEEYEKCNFLRNLELPKVVKDKSAN